MLACLDFIEASLGELGNLESVLESRSDYGFVDEDVGVCGKALTVKSYSLQGKVDFPCITTESCNMLVRIKIITFLLDLSFPWTLSLLS